MAPPTESSPLLPPSSDGRSPIRRSLFPPIRRVFFTAVVMSMTFAFTQTTLIYSFRTMTCDEYYKGRTFDGVGDRCSLPRIERDTARSLALMSTTTTTCTILNLFLTGFWIKRFGAKAAMFQQTAWAAGRNLCQIYAQTIGGASGIRVVQVTQGFNLMGSAGGYQLAANSFVAFLAEPEKRTSDFGILSGMAMLGSSLGYTFGGLVFRYFGRLAPFQVTFCLLIFSTIFGSVFLPYLPPDAAPLTDGKQKSFLAPLKIFLPTRKIDPVTGKRKLDFNLFLLGLGAFFSVLATGYVPMALQLVGTNVFGFKPTESGFMLSLTLLVKAFFLSICFPRIISEGRRLLSSTAPQSNAETTAPLSSSSSDTLASAPENHPERPTEADPHNVVAAPKSSFPPPATDFKHGSLFDLYFVRWSIFLDGCLAAGVSMASQGWHLYVAAGVLPFASGTGPACKGVTLDFVDKDERSDALGAIALIEKLAQVSTIGVFGLVFSALSEVGHPTLVFLANGGVAMIGFLLLCFVRMPRQDAIAP